MMNISKHKFLILATLLVLALATAYRFTFGEDAGSSSSSPAAAATAPTTERGGSPVSGAAARKASERPIRLQLPDLKKYREQGHRGPHGTPGVLKDFAHALAFHMERAFASQAYAEFLFAELRRCALEGSGDRLTAAQAICAVNAGRLSDRYSGVFRARFEELRGALTEPVAELVAAIES